VLSLSASHKGSMSNMWLAAALLLCIAGGSVPAFSSSTAFDRFIAGDKVVMVEFNCLHGDEYVSEFTKAADKVGHAAPIAFAAVRKAGTDLCERFTVHTYPQFIVFKGGREAKRAKSIGDAMKVISWVSNYTGVPIDIVRTVDSEAAAAALRSPADPVVFVCIAAPESATHQHFRKVASAHASSGWFAFIPKQSKHGRLYAARPNEPRVELPPNARGTIEGEAMLKFVREERMPLFARQDAPIYRRYFDGGILSVVEVGDIARGSSRSLSNPNRMPSSRVVLTAHVLSAIWRSMARRSGSSSGRRRSRQQRAPTGQTL
jgi:hypothetical protein